MEIEKKRETSWKIDLRNKDENIELTSVEIGGNVNSIKFSLKTLKNSTEVEMSKSEFYNFLSLLSAFKDVVIGDDEIPVKRDLNLDIDKNRNLEDEFIRKENRYDISSDEKENKEELDDLNPKEWDPW